LMIINADSVTDVAATVHKITSRRLSAVMPQRQSVLQPLISRPSFGALDANNSLRLSQIKSGHLGSK